MASAVFASNVSYEPGGGGSITQGFRAAFEYTAVNAGRWDVAPADPAVPFALPFGGVGVVKGLIVQNNTSTDIGIAINGTAATPVALFHLAPGATFMHWSATAIGAGSKGLAKVEIVPDKTTSGSVDFLVLGN